jgi:hypothetical protein
LRSPTPTLGCVYLATLGLVVAVIALLLVTTIWGSRWPQGASRSAGIA